MFESLSQYTEVFSRYKLGQLTQAEVRNLWKISPFLFLLWKIAELKFFDFCRVP